jgi:hypothetical protein
MPPRIFEIQKKLNELQKKFDTVGVTVYFAPTQFLNARSTSSLKIKIVHLGSKHGRGRSVCKKDRQDQNGGHSRID